MRQVHAVSQVFWEGTTVPRSNYVAKDYSELTKRLYHRWYNAPRGSKPAIRTLSIMNVHPSLRKIQWYDPNVMGTLKRNLGLGPLEPTLRTPLDYDAQPTNFEHALKPGELYPGQAYFHAHNPKIRRAEKSFFGAGLC